MYLSIVIPAYQEESRIGQSLEKIQSFLQKKKYDWEIIVVDDGSRDRTAEIAKQALARCSHKVLRNEANRGKGYSVSRGVLEAKGDLVLFTDADLSTPIEEIEKLILELNGKNEIALGSRGLASSEVQVHQSIFRETMGRIFNLLARILVFKGIRDSQCGFKMLKKGSARRLFTEMKINGFSFDAELVFLAQRKGIPISEVPVIWRNSFDSKIHVFKHSWEMFLDLLRIRWIHGWGKKLGWSLSDCAKVLSTVWLAGVIATYFVLVLWPELARRF